MEPFSKKGDTKDRLPVRGYYKRAYARNRRRVAKLEAELAQEQENHRICAERAHRQWARAEKAEAEVERLQRRIAELERLLTLSSSPLTHQGEPGVNPSGDGHLGGAPPGVSPSPPPSAHMVRDGTWHEGKLFDCPLCRPQGA